MYFQGFVIPVKAGNKQAFLDMAKKMAPFFAEYGAMRTVECWGDDLMDGKVTDLRKAVQANDDETVVFSWVWWPDKATCDAATKKDDGRRSNEARRDAVRRPALDLWRVRSLFRHRRRRQVRLSRRHGRQCPERQPPDVHRPCGQDRRAVSGERRAARRGWLGHRRARRQDHRFQARRAGEGWRDGHLRLDRMARQATRDAAWPR